MSSEFELNVDFHPQQERIFFGSQARKKVIVKGRRFGLTDGFARYLVHEMPGAGLKCLWIDTVSVNIDRYIERYFMPMLKQMPPEAWKWRMTKNELWITDSVLDMRSADRPENVEGFGYDIVIVNEAGIVLKDRYLWENAILPMTLDYQAKMLVGGTPKGKRDRKLRNRNSLFYELNEKGKAKERGWESFHFTSYDNPILSRSDIEDLEAEVPPSVRRQEIHAQFVDVNENPIFNREWWRYYSVAPEFRLIVQSWDTAFKKNEENDFSACTTWGVTNENKVHLLHWLAVKMAFPDLRSFAVDHAGQWRARVVLIEDKASGQSLVQEMERTTLNIVPRKPEGDKISRANAVTAEIEGGKVLLPSEAPWLEEYVSLMEEFPNGLEDDTIDSTTQALLYLRQHPSASTQYKTVTKRTDYGKGAW